MITAAAERANMVDSQVRPNDVPDLAVQDAMRRVAREALAPANRRALAYADAEIEYAKGRWLLRPRDIAKLLHALKPRAGERALALSAPYGAAVLADMGLFVVELDAATDPLTGEFDLVVCEGAVTRAPETWKGALAMGGRLGVVERDGPVGHAVLYLRTPEAIGRRVLFDSTPPLLAGFETRPGFVF